MRVLVVSAWPSQAAPEFGIFVKRQVKALRELGVQVEVAGLTDTRRGTLRVATKYLDLHSRARGIVRWFRPDVVHGHFLFPTGAVTRRAAAYAGAPYVVTAHGTDVRNTHGSMLLASATRGVLHHAAAVIAVSPRLAAQLVQHAGSTPLHVCDMGVDTAQFTPGSQDEARQHLVWHAGSPSVVSVGSLVSIKNHQRLIQAIAQIPSASLALVGAGPLELELRACAEQLGVDSRVRFAGRVRPRDVVHWLRAADVACLVSSEEGYGVAALEAAAAGTPVVISRNAPASALLPDDDVAVHVDPEDPAGIAAAITRAAPWKGQDGFAERARAATAGASVHARARETRDILKATIDEAHAGS